jgi:hypothetical protein
MRNDEYHGAGSVSFAIHHSALVVNLQELLEIQTTRGRRKHNPSPQFLSRQPADSRVDGPAEFPGRDLTEWLMRTPPRL